MSRIALLVPDLPSREELAPYLERIDATRWYSNFGPLVTELETRLSHALAPAQSAAVKVVTVANATLGLELALIALSLPPGARVLVPAVTFVASAASIVRAGLVPVLCDVDEESWLLTPEIARQVAKPLNIAAVMPVSTYGCSQDAEGWDRFTADTGLPVVLDAAGAFGNQTIPRRSCTVFSLHATKTLGAGEGGFVVSTDTSTLDRLRTLTNFGISLSDGLVHIVGTNAKLSEYHAAVALATLDSWEVRRARRMDLHRDYLRALTRYCPSIVRQKRSELGLYSIMPVLLPEGQIAETIGGKLAEQGIETRRWYCPTLERHPAYHGFPLADDLGVSTILSERLLALPFHTFLSYEDIETVCRGLARVIGEG